jgi:hypothetical protein
MPPVTFRHPCLHANDSPPNQQRALFTSKAKLIECIRENTNRISPGQNCFQRKKIGSQRVNISRSKLLLLILILLNSAVGSDCKD